VSRRRPGRLWLFFYGRRRRGFPGLLVGVLVAAVALGLLFGLPHGADLSGYVTVVAIGALVLLILGSLVLAAIAAVRPPRRGRR
jgi:amino acid transporter